MPTITEALAWLPPRHAAALNWFVQHSGTDQAWPQEVNFRGEPTLVATRAKGIYKPRWSTYSLSVRQTLGGPYHDEEPIHRLDGTWSYKYLQEGLDPAARDDAYTNVGLMACMRRGVPVGVMRQVSGKPNVRYHVLGIALVVRWDAGFFVLEGFAPGGSTH